MKKLILICLLLLTVYSCKKDDEIIPDTKITEYFIQSSFYRYKTTYQKKWHPVSNDSVWVGISNQWFTDTTIIFKYTESYAYYDTINNCMYEGKYGAIKKLTEISNNYIKNWDDTVYNGINIRTIGICYCKGIN